MQMPIYFPIRFRVLCVPMCVFCFVLFCFPLCPISSPSLLHISNYALQKELYCEHKTNHSPRRCQRDLVVDSRQMLLRADSGAFGVVWN